MPETLCRPGEMFNNSESSCHTTIILQMKVEAVNFTKSQQNFIICGLTTLKQNFKINEGEGGANQSPPGPNRVKDVEEPILLQCM